MKKTYILMRNTDYGPAGPFQLGNLLADPTTPESIIENSSPIQLPASIPLQTSSVQDFKDSHQKTSSGKYGIFAKFLSILGIGADISYEHSSTKSREVNAETLETKFFTPNKEYLTTIMQDPAVQAFVKGQMFRANVYVVTGLRVALGVGVGSETEERKGGVKISASVNGTLMGGPPIEIGPDVEMERGRKREQGWGRSADFVYAYRVKEVRYSAVKSKIVSKDVKGDLYSLDGKNIVKDETKEDGDEGVTLEAEVVGPEWVTAKSLRKKAVDVLDEDGEICEVMIP
jgi:hypothetical protein